MVELRIPRRTLVFGIAALIALASAPALHHLGQTGQTALALAGIGLLGLPHGAADAWLAAQRGLVTTTRSAAVFMVGYVGLAAWVVGLWIILPVLSLAVFLLISAWHFGGDWDRSGRFAFRLAAGCVLLCAPSLFFPEEVLDLYRELSGDRASVLVALQRFLFWPALLIFALFSLAHDVRTRQMGGSLEMATLILLAAVLPVLIWFMLFFCVLHAPRHLAGLWASASPEGRRALAVSSLLLTAVSLLAAALTGAVLIGGGIEINQALIQIGFVGLAALTVPHMALVDGRHTKRVLPGGGAA